MQIADHVSRVPIISDYNNRDSYHVLTSLPVINLCAVPEAAVLTSATTVPDWQETRKQSKPTHHKQMVTKV